MNEKQSIFHITKKRTAAAIMVAAAMLLITILAAAGEGIHPVLLISSVLISLFGGIYVLLDVHWGKLTSVCIMIIIPAAAFAALENYTHVLSDLSGPIIVLNLLFFYLLYTVCFWVTGSARIGYSIATLIPMLFGLTNYYVVAFRGTPIVPWDFLSLRTAVSVADNYDFTLTWKVSSVILLFGWMILISSGVQLFLKKNKVRIPGAVVSVILMICFLFQIQKSEVQSYFGMDTTLFTLNVLYRNNGIAAAFLGNLRFLNLEQPSGYSVRKVQEIAEDACRDSETEQKGDSDSKFPNVVVIMDEAFSDLSVWGNFATSEPVMPFFDRLRDEAVGGEVYVSVKGGNTANTEFEFLTGDTMAFLPKGSVPYQQYINYETPSLASYLKSLGYTTTAIHPYNASGWDRDLVYEKFGFDTFLSKTSFKDPLLMRSYISDQSAFEKIIELFEEKPADERQFIFEVTMQNHGGYSKDSPGFDIYVNLPQSGVKSTSIVATEKYLTLMNQTDHALEMLIRYFETLDEPVIVLMFGDHQPSDYITNVVQRICNVHPQDTLEFQETGYRVPFMIWSNYGLEHEYYDSLSVNYLGGILMKNAGIPLTGYQKFLMQLQEELPIVNALTYLDSDGNFHTYDDPAYENLLNEYKIVQYNHLVDRKHRNETFFGS